MSSLLLCQTVLCLVAPPVLLVPASLSPKSPRAIIIPATNILNHLIAVNPFVRFSQSDAHGNVIVDGSGYNHLYYSNNYYSPVGVAAGQNIRRPKPGIRPLKPFKIFGNTGDATEHRFGPILEYVVQRIQAQFSNYVHEDLSRPSLNSPQLPVEIDPVVEEAVIYTNGAEPAQVDSIEISAPPQESTLVPVGITTEDGADEYEGSGDAWITVNKSI